MGAEFLHADVQGERQTDRHDEANSRISQLCEHALRNEMTASPILTVMFVFSI
jgi:uncharacterized protein YigA (DUF484 family)